MIRWQTMTGTALGLTVGFTILALTSNTWQRRALSGPILSECDGHLRELVIQYEPSATGIVATAYHDFLGALETDVVVHAVCPNRAAFADLVSRVGQTRCTLLPIVVGHPMTTWSRDRWLALEPAASGKATTIWSPLAEAGHEVWPARAGDQKLGDDIAAALPHRVVARRSRLNFDGGDFLADSDTVFVMPRTLIRNIQQTVTNKQEFLDILNRELKRRVILLDEAPDHHAGMFMASIGNRIMLVADPKLGKAIVSDPSLSAAGALSNIVASLPGGPDFSPETQHLFDAVASQCATSGYRVVRIPVIPARDGRTYLTYANVLMDQHANHRVVYLPWYRGCEPLNSVARNIWEDMGYQVRPVDCTSTFRHFGCLHCLVNVLARTTATL